MNPNTESLRRMSFAANMISLATALGCSLLCGLAVIISERVGAAVWLVMAGALVLSFVSGYTLADAHSLGYLAKHDGRMQVHR